MSNKSRNNKTINQKPSIYPNNNLQMYNLSHEDKKILKILIMNPRLSYREIARNVKLSVTTVSNKIKNLTEAGVLKGFSTDVDASKLGYNLTAISLVTTSRGIFLDVAKKIADNKNVYAVYDIAGPCDTIVVGKFRGPEELNKFLEEIQKVPNVTKTETYVVLQTIKEDFRFIF